MGTLSITLAILYPKISNMLCPPFAENVKDRRKKKGLIALLVIAFLLTVIGVGLWIALAVIVYIAVFYRK